MYWSEDITSCRKTNKQIRTKPQHNKDIFATTLYILICLVQLLALFCPLSSSLRAWTWANLLQVSRLQNPKLCSHLCRTLCPISLSLCPTGNRLWEVCLPYPPASTGHTVLACNGATVPVGTAIGVDRHVFKYPAAPHPNFYSRLRRLNSVHHKFFIACIDTPRIFYQNKNNKNISIQNLFSLLYSVDFGKISKDNFSIERAIKDCTEKYVSNLFKILCVRLQATQQREINQGHFWCIGTCGPL